MAAVIPKSILPVTRNRTICATSVQLCTNHYYSTEPRIIKDPTTASLRRGTGGRSSFNGIVCTLFGGTSFTGRYLCNALGKIGTQVILPHRCEFDRIKHLKLSGDLGQILFHEFSIDDEEAIYKSVQYSNVVINTIGTYTPTRNYSFKDVNVEAARRIARISKECNVERLIHMSCLNVDPKPLPRVTEKGSNFYKTKWQGEVAVREEFPDATIIRPSDIYGIGDSFIRLYISGDRFYEGKLPVWGKEEVTKQPVSINNVIAGIIAAMQDHNAVGKTYQFVGPKRYRLTDIIEWIHDYTSNENMKFEKLDMTEKSISQILYKLKLSLNQSWRLHPYLGLVDLEVFERECTSDLILRNLPTLEDLGIVPTDLEKQLLVELRYITRRNRFLSQKAMFDPPPAIQPVG